VSGEGTMLTVRYVLLPVQRVVLLRQQEKFKVVRTQVANANIRVYGRGRNRKVFHDEALHDLY